MAAIRRDGREFQGLKPWRLIGVIAETKGTSLYQSMVRSIALRISMKLLQKFQDEMEKL